MQISSYTFKLVFIVISFLIGQASFVMAKTVIVDGIYLIVNSEMATRSQAKTVSAALKAQPQPTEGEQISHEEQLLMRMVQEMLLLDRAKALKIEPSEKEIESRLNQITRSQPKILEVYSEEDLQNQLYKDIKKQYVIGREVDSKIRIETNEINLFCQKMKRKNRKVGLAQILLKGSEQEIQEAELKIRTEFNNGISFEELAKVYSVDPNAKENAGKLGVFNPNDLLADIGNVAKELRPGELSQLIQTALGSHILFVYKEEFEEGLDCEQMTVEQNNQFSNALYSQKRENLLTVYMDELFACSNIEVKDPGESGLPTSASLPKVDQEGINCQARQVRVMTKKKETKKKRK